MPEVAPFQQAAVVQQMRRDRNLAAGAVVFFGGSHIMSLNVSRITPHGMNFGIGGDTTVGLLTRLPRYQSVGKARAVVVGIGFNDVKKRDAKAIVRNTREILDRIPVPVVLCGLFPIVPDAAHRSAETERHNAVIRDVNKALRDICKGDCVFVDPHPDLTGREPRLRDPDGIHLDRTGYDIWTGLIAEKLNELLKR